MPAATDSRRSAYSWGEIDNSVGACGDAPSGASRHLPGERGGRLFLLRRGTLVSGKLPDCLCDLCWVRHKKVFLWSVERHGGDVRGCDTLHGAVEVVEGVLG